MFRFLTIALLMAFAFGAHAEDADWAALSKSHATLEKAYGGEAQCSFRPLSVNRLHESGKDSLFVWIYNVSECYNGNNWFGNVATFSARDGGFVPSPFPNLSQPTPQDVFSNVVSVKYVSAEESHPDYITLIVRKWGPNDAHCCPTIEVEYRLWEEHGAMQTKVMRLRETSGDGR